MGAILTKSFTAWASSASSVMNASAWSWVRATYSASNVSGHLSWSATFHGEPAPAGWFVNVLAPFVAQLLARPPRLVLDDMSDLTTESSTRESALGQRPEAFAHFLDAIVYQRRWLVVDAPPGSLPSTDLGWIYMPGDFPGELFIPVTPSRALVVRGGRPWTYFHGDDLVDIPVVAWPPDQVRVRAEAMMLVAPREVYAATPDLTEHALRLWAQGDQPGRPTATWQRVWPGGRAG